MQKGSLIFLAGLTSAGKTSIVDAIQDHAEDFYYVVANDLYAQMVGDRYLREDYAKYECKAMRLMYHAARLYSDMGENVLIDGALFEIPEFPNHYRTVQEIFADSPLFLVEVYCPLEICRQRNLLRPDRYEMQSHEQSKVANPNVRYDFRVDTSLHAPEECAAQILAARAQWQQGHGHG